MTEVLDNSDIGVEEPCWHPRYDQNAEKCLKCRGDGGYPTRFGEEILKLVKKYGPVYELDWADTLYRTDAPPVRRPSDEEEEMGPSLVPDPYPPLPVWLRQVPPRFRPKLVGLLTSDDRIRQQDAALAVKRITSDMKYPTTDEWAWLCLIIRGIDSKPID